jgi:hypothetical protein
VKISDLCRLATEKMGFVLQVQALLQMELSLVEALSWGIDAVTPSHFIANLLALSHPPLPNLRRTVDFCLQIYYMYIAPHAAHRPSTVVQAIFAAVVGLSPETGPSHPEESDSADYHLILALLLQYTKGEYTSPLDPSHAMDSAEEKALQALRRKWLAWLPASLAPLGGAKPL